jgi:hypothetical protein
MARSSSIGSVDSGFFWLNSRECAPTVLRFMVLLYGFMPIICNKHIIIAIKTPVRSGKTHRGE